MKTALITGSTDGIGKSVALELAQKGYSIHVLGRNKSRGNEVLNILIEINPKGNHKLFLVDLSSKKAINDFLDAYRNKYESLDILVLNAGIFPQKGTLSPDGIDLVFSIVYISRFLFTVKLNSLLENSREGKVVHLGGSKIVNIKYDSLKTPNYSRMYSIWQGSTGSAFIVNYWSGFAKSNVAHFYWQPGIVNTGIVKGQSWLIRQLAKLMGMIEPEVAAKALVKNITKNAAIHLSGKFYNKGKLDKKKSSLLNLGDFKKLVRFSEEFTSISVKEYTE